MYKRITSCQIKETQCIHVRIANGALSIVELNQIPFSQLNITYKGPELS